MKHLTDEELLKKASEARRAAHDAPLNPYHLDHDGHRWIEFISTAWKDRANEWIALAEEIDRRGLKQPPMTWDGDSNRSKPNDPERRPKPDN